MSVAEIDFERWGVIAPKDQTGLGRMAEDLAGVLGLGWRFIADSTHMTSAPPADAHEIPVAAQLSREGVSAALNAAVGLHGVFVFERLAWNEEFFRQCRVRGVAVVCVPMWEWFRCDRIVRPLWDLVDVFVCPNAMCLRVLQRFGFNNVVQLPWCLDLRKLPMRTVNGPARVFIHNAGLVDTQDRKGTRDTIEAFRCIRRKDIRLIVRMQREAELPPLDGRIEVRVGNLDNVADLYAEGDVAVQPSKMEGLGFMVLEPVACGIPTITLDYPPMNEYVRQPGLLVRPLPFKRRAFPTAWVRHAHLRLPSRRRLARAMERTAESDLAEWSAENRRWAVTEFDRRMLVERWREAAAQAVRKRQE